MRQVGKFHCGVEACGGLSSDGRETLSRLSGKLQDVGQRWVFDLGSVLPCKDLGPNHTCCIGITIHSRCLEVVCRGFELEHSVDTISWKHPIQWAEVILLCGSDNQASDAPKAWSIAYDVKLGEDV